MIVDPELLRDALPGRWAIRATNFPMWLHGERRAPRIEYRMRRADPLVLDDIVSYVHDRRGPGRIVGTDRLRGDGFVWRGRGMLGVLRSRWVVAGLDGPVLAIRFARSVVTPAGADLLVREGEAMPELRTHAAERLEALGLTPEEFASLGWLPE